MSYDSAPKLLHHEEQVRFRSFWSSTNRHLCCDMSLIEPCSFAGSFLRIVGLVSIPGYFPLGGTGACSPPFPVGAPQAPLYPSGGASCTTPPSPVLFGVPRSPPSSPAVMSVLVEVFAPVGPSASMAAFSSSSVFQCRHTAAFSSSDVSTYALVVRSSSPASAPSNQSDVFLASF